MTGISLHMQWPQTSQSHGSFLKDTICFFFHSDQTPSQYFSSFVSAKEQTADVDEWSRISGSAPAAEAPTPTVAPKPAAAAEKPAEQPKPEKKKKEKPAAAGDKSEKKPPAEEEAVHVGRYRSQSCDRELQRQRCKSLQRCY
jgi:hypothetical protein